MNNLSDHFRTAGVMAHMLRHKPDGYEAECAALLARSEGETRGRVRAYLEAGVAPVVIEALLGREELTEENLQNVLAMQKTVGAWNFAQLIQERNGLRIKARQLGMTRLTQMALERQFKEPRVTIGERRAKRRERRGR